MPSIFQKALSFGRTARVDTTESLYRLTHHPPYSTERVNIMTRDANQDGYIKRYPLTQYLSTNAPHLESHNYSRPNRELKPQTQPRYTTLHYLKLKFDEPSHPKEAAVSIEKHQSTA